MTTENEPRTITMDLRTQRFYQGVNAAQTVLDAHADVDFPDEETRVKLFFFYAGAIAVEEHKCSTEEDFTNFLLGLLTRAPQPTDDEETD